MVRDRASVTPRWREPIFTLGMLGLFACGGASSGPPAGASTDAGTSTDGSVSADAGVTVDAGTGDTGAPRDAAPADAPFHARFEYQAIDAPSPRRRLVFDDERQAIYGVNRLDEQIERFAFASGRWSALDPLIIPQLMDLVMARDHRSLIVVAQDALDEISLTSGAFVAEHRVDNPDVFCGAVFDNAAAAGNGKIFIARTLLGCTGFSQSYIYDVQDRSLTRSVSLDRGLVGGSADGSRLYIDGLGDELLFIYNGLTGSTSSVTLTEGFTAVTVSDNASRVILQNAHVYSRSLTFLGNLRAGGIALASHDSTRAFVYRDDAPGPRIEIYNLDAELEAGNLYPMLGTVSIPDAPNATTGVHPPVAMTSTPDDTVVFVSGDRRLLVVPLHAM